MCDPPATLLHQSILTVEIQVQMRVEVTTQNGTILELLLAPLVQGAETTCPTDSSRRATHDVVHLVHQPRPKHVSESTTVQQPEVAPSSRLGHRCDGVLVHRLVVVVLELVLLAHTCPAFPCGLVPTLHLFTHAARALRLRRALGHIGGEPLVVGVLVLAQKLVQDVFLIITAAGVVGVVVTGDRGVDECSVTLILWYVVLEGVVEVARRCRLAHTLAGQHERVLGDVRFTAFRYASVKVAVKVVVAIKINDPRMVI